MSNFSWMVGGGIGWFLAGPLGAVIGGVIGHAVGKTPRDSIQGSFNRRQYYQKWQQNQQKSSTRGDLILSFLALIAEVIKADGKIRSSEVQTVKAFLVKSYGKNRASDLMNILKKLLNNQTDIMSVCYQIKLEMEANYKLQIIQLLFEIAKADDELLEIEINVIRDLSKKIGVPVSQFNSIRAMYSQADGVSDYRVLGLKRTATDAAIKSTYRQLVKVNHPDKVAHLGKEFRVLAEKKMKEINAAYHRIKQQRHFK